MAKQPSSFFLSTRKGLLTTIVLVLTTVPAIGITVQAARGKIAWEAAFMLLTGLTLPNAITMSKAIDGIAREDSAQKTADGAAKPPAEPPAV